MKRGWLGWVVLSLAWVSWWPGVAPAAEPLLMPGKKTLYHPIDNAGHSAGRGITPRADHAARRDPEDEARGALAGFGLRRAWPWRCVASCSRIP